MIYIGFKNCNNTAEEMHKESMALRDSMLNKLCDNYNPKNITHTQKGKPMYEGIGFSVSHSDGAVAVAVNIGEEKRDTNEDWQTFSGGTDFSVGVDMEPANRRVDANKLSKRFLSEKESEYVAGDNVRFLEIWTKKESVSKLTGEGVASIGHFCTFTLNNICIETRRVMLGGKEYIVSVSYYKTLD